MPRNQSSPLSQPMFSEPTFNEQGTPTPDPTSFRTPHDPKQDDVLYNEFKKLMEKDTVSFDTIRGKNDDLLSLATALGSNGPSDVQDIQKSGKVVFHAIGDSGASNERKLPGELNVADHITNDFNTSTGADRPAFLYHLGDVVYSFGESQFYYDQFYEPFRNYPAPIFAIPGNHDSFVIPGTQSGETPLDIFTRNFCSPTLQITKEAYSLHRTAMTQPGVYFALDAPFVRIIGLFSNALEDPGLISSQSGQKTTWPGVPDYQLDFLAAQLKRIKAEKYTGAVIIAVHHPPFTYAPSGSTKSGHVGNTMMLREIDAICQTQGVYPHAFLSGHAHNYQRYTRNLSFGGNDYSVPFVVAGNGGHNITLLPGSQKSTIDTYEPIADVQVDYLDPNPVLKTKGLTLDMSNDRNYGYLRVTVDSKRLQIEMHTLSSHTVPASVDKVAVDIATHKIA